MSSVPCGRSAASVLRLLLAGLVLLGASLAAPPEALAANPNGTDVYAIVKGAGTIVIRGEQTGVQTRGDTCGEGDLARLRTPDFEEFPTTNCSPLEMFAAPGFACANQAPLCDLTMSATANLPSAQLTPTELAGWKFGGWITAPTGCQANVHKCVGVKWATCTLDLQTTKYGCEYEDRIDLTASFDDIAPPTARFEEDPPKQFVNSTGTASFLLRSTEYAAEEQSKFECLLDLGDWTDCPAPTRELNGHRIAFSNLKDAEHTLKIRAVDPSLNRQTATAAAVTWEQRYPPVTLITAGPLKGSVVNRASATFEFKATVPTRTDAIAASFSCELNGVPRACPNGTLPLADLGQGIQIFRVRATRTDVEPPLEETAWQEVIWTVDSIAPTTTITSGPTDLLKTNARTVTFTFSAPDAVGYHCSLDQAEPAPCNAGTVTYDVAPGPHTFAVSATDAAGNRESAKRRSWEVIADGDGDGFLNENDCNDGNPRINPAAVETARDGVDSNCDGGLDADDDAAQKPTDCDDSNADVNPSAVEVPENGRDDDCKPGGVDGDADNPPVGASFKIKWFKLRGKLRITELTIGNALADARVRITCKGGGCPKKPIVFTTKKAAKVLAIHGRLGRKPTLKTGATVTVTVTKPGFTGQGRAFTVKKRGVKDRDFCIRRGVKIKGAC